MSFLCSGAGRLAIFYTKLYTLYYTILYYTILYNLVIKLMREFIRGSVSKERDSTAEISFKLSLVLFFLFELGHDRT